MAKLMALKPKNNKNLNMLKMKNLKQNNIIIYVLKK
jgi:hypothetical protein